MSGICNLVFQLVIVMFLSSRIILSCFKKEHRMLPFNYLLTTISTRNTIGYSNGGKPGTLFC